MFMALRSSGAAFGASTYHYNAATNTSSGTGSSQNAGVIFWHIGTTAPSLTTQQYGTFTGDIVSPALAEWKQINGIGYSANSGTWETRIIGGRCETATASDGLYLWSDSGTVFSGTVQIYGYR
jgi:hypothetical protein